MRVKRLILFSLLVVFATSVFAQFGSWEKLGDRRVDFKGERDVINSSNKGVFSALQIRVEGAPVEFDRVVVTYLNGGKQEIQLRNVIPAGGQSRVIDLKGNKRVIKDISFWYRSEKGHRGKATVSVWGRK